MISPEPNAKRHVITPSEVERESLRVRKSRLALADLERRIEKLERVERSPRAMPGELSGEAVVDVLRRRRDELATIGAGPVRPDERRSRIPGYTIFVGDFVEYPWDVDDLQHDSEAGHSFGYCYSLGGSSTPAGYDGIDCRMSLRDRTHIYCVDAADIYSAAAVLSFPIPLDPLTRDVTASFRITTQLSGKVESSAHDLGMVVIEYIVYAQPDSSAPFPAFMELPMTQMYAWEKSTNVEEAWSSQAACRISAGKRARLIVGLSIQIRCLDGFAGFNGTFKVLREFLPGGAGTGHLFDLT